MPQLNPAHWFPTLLATWTFFFSLFYFINKTETPTFPFKQSYSTMSLPWEWP